MREENRFYLVIIAFILIVISVPLLGLMQEKKAKLVDIVDAINGDEIQLIYLGSATCPWCEKFDPIIAKVAKEEKFDYIYMDIDSLTDHDRNELFKIIVNNNLEIGVPLTLLAGNGRIINGLPGFVDEIRLRNFLIENNFIEGEIIEISEDNFREDETEFEESEEIEYNDENEEETSENDNGDTLVEVKALLNNSQRGILVIGRSSCPACRSFVPDVHAAANEYGFSYIYVDSDNETLETVQSVISLINRDIEGVPYSVVVGQGNIYTEIKGAVPKDNLVTILKNNGVIE